MATNNGQENPDEKNPKKDSQMNSENGFEFIDEDAIESVKRGRKAYFDQEMIAFFQKTKVGQMVKIAKLAIDSNLLSELEKEIAQPEKDMEKINQILSEIRKAKAKRSAMIRVQAERSNWQKATIQWDKYGIPYAKRQA